MGSNIQLFITVGLYSLPGMVIGFTLHELMHGVVADRLGDPLPRSQGRLTLDPLTQIDPVGFAMLYGLGFGFARPVQINTMRIRSDAQRAAVAAAGPLTNLAVAAVLGIVLRLWTAAQPGVVYPNGSRLSLFFDGFPYLGHGGIAFIVFWILYLGMFVNALLFIFNLIPIPPLDGFQVFKFLFRRAIPEVIDWMERNAQILSLAALFLFIVLPTVQQSSTGNFIFDAVQHVTDVIYGGTLPPVQSFVSLLQALRSS